MAAQGLVMKLTDVPMLEMANGKFRDVFQITDETFGPDTKISAGQVWLAPGNTEGHVDVHDQDEAFYIISGHAQYYADGELIDVEPGDTVYCPAGTEHTFYTGDEMLHIFWLIAGTWTTDLADIKQEVADWVEVDGTTGWHLG